MYTKRRVKREHKIYADGGTMLGSTTFVLHSHSRHSRPALAEKIVHSCGDHVKRSKQVSAHEHFVRTHVCVILARWQTGIVPTDLTQCGQRSIICA